LEQDDAEIQRVKLERQWKEVYNRDKLVELEEALQSLERLQATEREREQEEWKRLHGIMVGKDLKQYEASTKQREKERTKELIEMRLQKVHEEDRLQGLEREWSVRREQAQVRVRSAMEKLRRLQEDAPIADAQSRGLAEIQRRLEELLRDVAELRRAADGKAPAK
jgi:hypothetical protein